MNAVIGRMERKETIDQLIIGYVFLFLIWRAFMSIQPIVVPVSNTTAGSLLKGLVYLGGFALIGMDCFVQKRIRFGRNMKWLLLLGGSVLISELIHYKYVDLSTLIKQCVKSSLFLLLVYTVGLRMTERVRNRFLKILYCVLSMIFMPSMLYMFFQFLTLQHYVVAGTNQGWFEGRLYGIMVSPFAGAMIAAILAFAAGYLFFSGSKGLMQKSLYGAGLIIYILYMILSDTRTVYVACAAGFGILLFWRFRKAALADEKRRIVYLIKGSLSFLLIILVMFLLIKGTRTAGLYFVQKINHDAAGAATSFSEFKDMQDRPKGTTFTSRRAYIWRSYFDVLTDQPVNFVFGLSLSGSSECIRKEYPDAYIVKDFKYLYPELYEKGDVHAAHNTYLTVLVYSGIIGLIFLLVFLCKSAQRFLRSLIHNTLSNIEITMGVIVVMILTAGLFESTPFFDISVFSCFVWLCTGFLMNGTAEEAPVNKV